VGGIPGGATVELGTSAPAVGAGSKVTFILNDPDYTTADRVASAINGQLGAGTAEARDASAIEVRVPEEARNRPVGFLSRLENVLVEPDRRARVVINERTGTIVSGGDVRISKVSVSHGDLKVSVAAYTAVSQPMTLGTAGPGVRTAAVTNSRMEVDEQPGQAFVSNKNTVADLVQALTQLRIQTRDIISVLRAIKAAGALHADLLIQ
jgi:flagellar P-ring protein precursor FlgI